MSKDSKDSNCSCSILTALVLTCLTVVSCHRGDVDENENQRNFSDTTEPTATRLLSASTTSDIELELRGKGRFERNAALHLLVHKMKSKRLTELFDQSEDFAEGHIRDEFQQVAIRRLALLDPRNALAMTIDFPVRLKEELISIIFEEWSVTDTNEAIEHAQGLSRSERNAALRGLVRARHDLPEIELGVIGHALGNPQLVADSLSSSLAATPVEDHPKAWKEFRVRHGGDAMQMSGTQLDLLMHIAESWLKRENGGEAVKELFSTLENDASRIRVLGQLLESIATDQPLKAMQMAVSTGELSRRIGVRVMDRVMMRWAERDGPEALAAATAMEDIVPRARNQRTVVGVWAKVDPISLLADLGRLPSHLREYGHVEGLKSLAESDPEAAVGALLSVADANAKREIARTLAVSLAGRDLRAAMQWVQSSADPVIEGYADSLRTFMLREAVRIGDIQLAVDVALEQPDIATVGWVVERVANHHGSESALNLLEQVTDSDARQIAHVGIGHALIREGRSTQAIELVKELPMEYQVSYFESIGDDWAEYEPHDLFDKLDDLPSDEIRESLAISLAAISDTQLSDEQKEKLRGLLPPVFRRMMD